MFKSVLSTYIRFFDINPLGSYLLQCVRICYCIIFDLPNFFIGRIMNRFSKDIGLIDESIPSILEDFAFVKFHHFFQFRHFIFESLLFQHKQCLMTILGALGTTIYLNFWIIIPILPLSVLFVFVRRYFIVCSLEVKRIDAISNMNFKT